MKSINLYKIHLLIFYLALIIAQLDAITFEEDVSLSLKQKKILDQFRSRVIDMLPHDYMKTEIYLIKWLRVSNFEINLAEERLLQNLEWRKEQKMDTIHSEDWSDMWNNDFRYYTEGRDKMGRPFVYMDMKHYDTRRAVLQGRGDRLARYHDKIIDDLCGLVQKLGEQYGNVTRGHLLGNFEGFNPLQHACIRCIPLVLKNVFGYFDHYPECVDKAISVNSPASLEAVLDIGRPLLSEAMRKRMFVFGTNKKDWMEALKKDFDLDQLPPSLGGTRIYKGMEKEYDNY